MRSQKFERVTATCGFRRFFRGSGVTPLLVIASALPAVGAGWQASGLEYVSRPEGSELILGFDQQVQYGFGRLSDPSRAYIDLRLADVPQWTMPSIPTDDVFVHRIRIGRPQPGTVRVVLDLKSPCDASVAASIGVDSPPAVRPASWK